MYGRLSPFSSLDLINLPLFFLNFTQWMVNYIHTKLSIFDIPLITHFPLPFMKLSGVWIGTNHIPLYLVTLTMLISYIGAFPFFFKTWNGHELHTQTFLLNMSFLFSVVPVIVAGVTVSHQPQIWKLLCQLQMKELHKSSFFVNLVWLIFLMNIS